MPLLCFVLNFGFRLYYNNYNSKKTDGTYSTNEQTDGTHSNQRPSAVIHAYLLPVVRTRDHRTTRRATGQPIIDWLLFMHLHFP